MPKYNLLYRGKAAEYMCLSLEVQTKKFCNSGSFSFKLLCLLTWIILTWFFSCPPYFTIHLFTLIVCVCVCVCVWCFVVVYSLSCVWLLQPHGLYSPSDSSVRGISQTIILEWVAISSSRGSSWSRDWTCIFCIGRRILSHWVTRETHLYMYYAYISPF